LEAALLLGEFVNEYFKGQDEKGFMQRLDRARAVNTLRKPLTVDAKSDTLSPKNE
jgi:hypothetical protein